MCRVFVLIWLMSFNATVKKKSVFYKFNSCFLLHIAQNKRELMGFSTYLVPKVLLVQSGQKYYFTYTADACLEGVFSSLDRRANVPISNSLKKNIFNNLFFSVIRDLLRNILLPSRGQKGMNLCFPAPPGELGPSSGFCSQNPHFAPLAQ